jgi:hypothetical protein
MDTLGASDIERASVEESFKRVPWRSEGLPSPYEVVEGGEDDDGPIHDDAVVHRGAVGMRGRGEEGKDVERQEVDQRRRVDQGTPFPKRELGLGELGGALESSEENAGNGDHVRCDHRARGEREDGSERGCAAQIDQGNENGTDQGDHEGLERDVVCEVFLRRRLALNWIQVSSRGVCV